MFHGLDKARRRAFLLDRIEGLQRGPAALFSSILENVGPLKQWPLHTLAQMLSDHLTYQARINLVLFLLGNRCPPNMIAWWLITRNMLHDKAARLHVANLIKEHKQGKLTQFTTYMLPFRVTAPDKPLAQRKHPWDGVGDPMPHDANPSAFVFPVETPLVKDGWLWDNAYAMLLEVKTSTIAFSASVPELKIVPVQDPDELDDDEGRVNVDMYGMPMDSHMAECMDVQVAMHLEATAGVKRPVPPTLTEACLKRAHPPAGPSELFD